jgi:hypothetical protein
VGFDELYDNGYDIYAGVFFEAMAGFISRFCGSFPSGGFLLYDQFMLFRFSASTTSIWLKHSVDQH